MSLLKNKVVFITGASSGIGKACAEAFAAEKANLILTARRVEKLAELASKLIKEYKVKVHTAQMDIRNHVDIKYVLKNLPEDFQKIDILLNNAGKARGLNKIYEGDVDHWEEMIDTNVKGLLYATREILPSMVERKKGHIINIGSTAGHEVYGYGNVYCATKFAVNALTQSIRIDVLDKGIKVTSIDPGMVETEFSLVRFSGDKEKAESVYKGVNPLTPEDVAQAVVFAASRPENVNINEIILTPLSQASSNHVFRK